MAKISRMALVLCFGKMALSTRGISFWTSHMGMVVKYSQTVNITRGISRKAKQMDKESSKILMEASMKVIGKMISSMALEKRFGIMELKPTRESL